MTTTQPTTGVQDKLDKVRKLLAKAEGAATAEEAESYSAKATELMLRYSIDEALLGQQPTSTDTVGSRRFEVKFYPKQKVNLLSGIANAFGAEAVYFASGRGSLVVMVYGWESDLAMIEVLFSSLNMQADREAEREMMRFIRATYGMAPHPDFHGKSFKTSFLIGFAQTVTGRLATQRSSAVREAEDTAPGTSLVLIDRKRAVTRAFHQAHPNTRKGTSSSLTSHAGYYSGQDAGKRADLGTGGSRLSATGNRSISR